MSCAAAVAIPSLVPVPGGPFRMGSETGRPDERPVRVVEVEPFLLGRTPVTNAEYAPFVSAGLAPAPPFWSAPAFCGPRHPVVGVTWFEAAWFAEWLGEELGGAWRLPTEAEWERAARGGIADGSTAWGDLLPDGEVPSGPLDGPWPAGAGTPNGYGLFDMGTIVHEWCLDEYPGDPRRRASRGGSWRHRVRWSSPSARSSLLPELRYSDYGFRVLREAP
ncbi:MAG TPA: SUMF1/EgtB/PvdO family nonheme iron enzyme [Vicinamibacteria bacterium]|nr:SUMF1/EgtB/PvdO family nonheme iron enzyme [Vicinamibacteria bacterium]